MAQGRVSTTPTGYGVIKVTAHKQVVVAKVKAPSLVQSSDSGSIQVKSARGGGTASGNKKPS